MTHSNVRQFVYAPLMKRVKVLLGSEWAVLGLIILTAFMLRLQKLSSPIADWHSFRQADTASVTREYVKHGVDLLRPRYHDLSNIQSGAQSDIGGYAQFVKSLEKYPLLHQTYHKLNGYRKSIFQPITSLLPAEKSEEVAVESMQDNLEGWRMVEFPLINGAIAITLRTFPFLPLVETSRLFAIAASLGTIVFSYLWTKQYFQRSVAMLTALTLAVLPYSIFYSRVILPEPFQLMFLMMSLWSFGEWLDKKSLGWLLVSALALSVAMLLKPFTVFLGTMYAAMLSIEWLQARKKRDMLKWIVYLVPFFLIAFTPFMLWRGWIQQFPTGIPASDWLFNGNGIRFRPAWFRWLGYERILKLFLGIAGGFFLLAIPTAWLARQRRQQDPSTRFSMRNEMLIITGGWTGILVYFSIIASGNVQHDYYQNLILPVLALSVGYGAVELYHLLVRLFVHVGGKKFARRQVSLPRFSLVRRQAANVFDSVAVTQSLSSLISGIVVAVLYLTMLFVSWQRVAGYFNVNHWEYIEAGAAVDRLTPSDAKVIAPAMGDTVFLFQTNRTGWPIGFEIEQKIANGATHYVTTTFDDEARALEDRYHTVEKTENYLILDLTQVR